MAHLNFGGAPSLDSISVCLSDKNSPTPRARAGGRGGRGGNNQAMTTPNNSHKKAEEGIIYRYIYIIMGGVVCIFIDWIVQSVSQSVSQSNIEW